MYAKDEIKKPVETKQYIKWKILIDKNDGTGSRGERSFYHERELKSI